MRFHKIMARMNNNDCIIHLSSISRSKIGVTLFKMNIDTFADFLSLYQTPCYWVESSKSPK